jgi:hypothetical protein
MIAPPEVKTPRRLEAIAVQAAQMICCYAQVTLRRSCVRCNDALFSSSEIWAFFSFNARIASKAVFNPSPTSLFAKSDKLSIFLSPLCASNQFNTQFNTTSATGGPGVGDAP